MFFIQLTDDLVKNLKNKDEPYKRVRELPPLYMSPEVVEDIRKWTINSLPSPYEEVLKNKE